MCKFTFLTHNLPKFSFLGPPNYHAMIFTHSSCSIRYVFPNEAPSFTMPSHSYTPLIHPNRSKFNSESKSKIKVNIFSLSFIPRTLACALILSLSTSLACSDIQKPKTKKYYICRVLFLIFLTLNTHT